MIALINSEERKDTNTCWHHEFLKMLPDMRRYAWQAFRQLPSEARSDAVQEVLASVTVAYARLFELGKTDVAYPSVLARYAIAQYREGRRVGTKMNCQDILSPYAQKKKTIRVERLDHYCNVDGDWQEVLVEDKHSDPAEIAASRIDFAEWLAGLTNRRRHIAMTLAGGESTSRAAKRFHVSRARISQIRQELRTSWQEFQGEIPAKVPTVAS